MVLQSYFLATLISRLANNVAHETLLAVSLLELLVKYTNQFHSFFRATLPSPRKQLFIFDNLNEEEEVKRTSLHNL